MSDIASVSLQRPLRDFSEELGQSFAEYGFAIVRDHGIPSDLIARAEAKSRAFFALPEAVKMRYHLQGKGGARGYTPFGIERAKDAAVHDLKEFWHVGRTLPPGHALEPYMQPNVWPAEVESFRDTFETLYAAFEWRYPAGNLAPRPGSIHVLVISLRSTPNSLPSRTGSLSPVSGRERPGAGPG